MTLPTPRVRPSRAQDIEVIFRIYADEVKNGTASFEVTPPGRDELAQRRTTLCHLGYPYLVAEIQDCIAGYGYVGQYRPRPAYRYTVENSVYIARWARRRGVGSALLNALIEQCEDRGFRQMIAVIGNSEHVASIRLHERAGFRMVGTLENVGFKHGRWLDTVLMQRPLDPGGSVAPSED